MPIIKKKVRKLEDQEEYESRWSVLIYFSWFALIIASKNVLKLK